MSVWLDLPEQFSALEEKLAHRTPPISLIYQADSRIRVEVDDGQVAVTPVISGLPGQVHIAILWKPDSVTLYANGEIADPTTKILAKPIPPPMICFYPTDSAVERREASRHRPLRRSDFSGSRAVLARDFKSMKSDLELRETAEQLGDELNESLGLWLKTNQERHLRRVLTAIRMMICYEGEAQPILQTFAAVHGVELPVFLSWRPEPSPEILRAGSILAVHPPPAAQPFAKGRSCCLDLDD